MKPPGIIKEFGGDVDKFVGDEVMAVFSGEGMATRALACGVRILAAVEELKARNGLHLDIGIGINCGFVVQGNIGSEDRSDFTVIGDPVNVAARLCSKAEAGQILAGAAVQELAAAEHCPVLLAANGTLVLKGKPDPVPVFAVSTAPS